MDEKNFESLICDLDEETMPKLAVRRHSRARLDMYVNKIAGDEPHLARVRDISSSGLYLYKLLEPENLPERVALELQLPTDKKDDVIWAVGEVVREEANESVGGVGIQFVRIADSDRDRIARYVDRNEFTLKVAPDV